MYMRLNVGFHRVRTMVLSPHSTSSGCSFIISTQKSSAWPSLGGQKLKEEVLAVLGELLRELDVEGDEDVAPLGGLLGLGQAVARDTLHRPGLHDLVGEVDGDLLGGEGGDVHQHSAQRLQPDRQWR